MIDDHSAIAQRVIEEIHTIVRDLDIMQRSLVLDLVKVLQQKFISFKITPVPGLPEEALSNLGDLLRIHHVFSRKPFTKDKFEYALERVLKISGMSARLAPRGNRGHDITIDNAKFSLKTQADRSIKPEELYISKFMELGKGNWTDNIEDLFGLLDQFFEHICSYDRILTLRCLSARKGAANEGFWSYELVEIPKQLFDESRNGSFRIMRESRQMPKPGYCDVSDEFGIRYQLYFDGGTERKLQIKRLRKDLCTQVAEWVFSVNS